MTYSLQFQINALPKIPSNGSHGHWSVIASQKKKWRALTIAAIGYRRPTKPLNKATITLTRHSSMRPDMDNLAISFKPVMDGIVAAEVVTDDSPEFVKVNWLWQSARPGSGFITASIVEGF
jgi:Holliday junction resolvase RusA-like endonuclease